MVPKWEAELDRAVDAMIKAPFAWGANDCCSAAAGIIMAISGRDIMGGLRGAYSDQAGALRIVAGNPSLAEIIDATGLPLVPPQYATKGDLVFFRADNPFGGFAAVCLGKNAITKGEHGAILRSMRDATKAWRVE